MGDRTYTAEEAANFMIEAKLYSAITKTYGHEPTLLEHAKEEFERIVPEEVRRIYERKNSGWKEKFERMFNLGSELEKKSK